MGLEPIPTVWKTIVLPLNTKDASKFFLVSVVRFELTPQRPKRWMQPGYTIQRQSTNFWQGRRGSNSPPHSINNTMHKTYICEYCQTSFMPNRTGEKRRFCSGNCYKTFLQLQHEQKYCLCCNDKIHHSKKFCNSSCAAIFNNKEKPRHKSSKMHTIFCYLCSSPFECSAYANKKKCLTCTITSKIVHQTCTSPKLISRSKLISKPKLISRPQGPYSKVYFNTCQKSR